MFRIIKDFTAEIITPCAIVKKFEVHGPEKGNNASLQYMGAFTYDVSSRGGGGFEMLTVADKGGRGSKPC